MHFFMKTLLKPEACLVVDFDQDMETLTDENTVTIQLMNDHGEPYYLDSTLNSHQLFEMLRLSLVFNSDDGAMRDEYPHFQVAKGTKSEGTCTFGVTEFNKVKCELGLLVDANNHSLVLIRVNPSHDGDFHCHVLLGNYELGQAPVAIAKSEEHKRQEQLAQDEQDRLAKLALLRQKDRQKRQELKLRQKREKEEERLRQQRAKEEALARKREETEKRAQEAVRRAKEARDRELLLKEEERKMRKEMRTGGGFNMAKVKRPETSDAS